MIDFDKIPSPCYVIEESLLRRNLALIKQVKEAALVNIILAFNQNKEGSKSFGGKDAATKLQALLREDSIDVAIHLPKSRGKR